MVVCCDNARLAEQTEHLEPHKEKVEERMRYIQQWYRTDFTESRTLQFCKRADDICPVFGFTEGPFVRLGCGLTEMCVKRKKTTMHERPHDLYARFGFIDNGVVS